MSQKWLKNLISFFKESVLLQSGLHCELRLFVALKWKLRIFWAIFEDIFWNRKVTVHENLWNCLTELINNTKSVGSQQHQTKKNWWFSELIWLTFLLLFPPPPLRTTSFVPKVWGVNQSTAASAKERHLFWCLFCTLFIKTD